MGIEHARLKKKVDAIQAMIDTYAKELGIDENALDAAEERLRTMRAKRRSSGHNRRLGQKFLSFDEEIDLVEKRLPTQENVLTNLDILPMNGEKVLTRDNPLHRLSDQLDKDDGE